MKRWTGARFAKTNNMHINRLQKQMHRNREERKQRGQQDIECEKDGERERERGRQRVTDTRVSSELGKWHLAVEGNINLRIAQCTLLEKVHVPLASTRPLLGCTFEQHRPVPGHVDLALLHAEER
jgi:hypothetical protein